MRRKLIAAVSAAMLSLVVLTGCQTLNATTAFKLDSAGSYSPKALEASEEQRFYSTAFVESFENWVEAAGWDTSYKVDGSPLTWIPQKQDSAFPSTVSANKCEAWIEWESGYKAASITSAYVYRISKDSKTADGHQIAELLQHLSSDMKRQGWKSYDVSNFGSSEGNAGQLAWYSPPKDGVDYNHVKDYFPDVAGEADIDYISYRIMAVDRGDGYLSLYVSTPCAPVDTMQYEQLKGDIASSEIDLIQSDTKNNSNTEILP